MEDLKKKLEQDEIIKWEKIEIKNFFYLPEVLIIISVSFTLEIIIAFIIKVLWINFLIISSLLIMAIFVIVEDLNKYLRLKRDLNLSGKELRHYESFQVLTNKRFIERQIYYREYLPNYSDVALKMIADLRFLNLICIRLIIVQRLKNVIYFYTQDFINEYGDTDYFIEVLDPYLNLRGSINIYCRKDPNQLEKAFTALNSILPLERIFQNENGEIYTIKGKNVKINLFRKEMI